MRYGLLVPDPARRFFLVVVLMVSAGCGRPGFDPLAPTQCGVELFADYTPLRFARSNLAVGSKLSVDWEVLTPGLDSTDLREERGPDSFTCNDTTTTAGKIAARIAGVVGLGAGQTRAIASRLAIDSIVLVRVADVSSLPIRRDEIYLWAGVRLGSFRFDGRALSGVDLAAAADSVTKKFGGSFSYNADTSRVVHFSGADQFVGVRVVKFQPGPIETVAETLLVRSDRTRSVRLGNDYILRFLPRLEEGERAGWNLELSGLDTVINRHLPALQIPGDIIDIRRQALSGGVEVERLELRDLDLTYMEENPNQEGVVGHFTLLRQMLNFRRVDEPPTRP